jgi:hypothetical protein
VVVYLVDCGPRDEARLRRLLGRDRRLDNWRQVNDDLRTSVAQ